MSTEQQPAQPLSDEQLQQIRERTALLQRSGLLDNARPYDPVAIAARDDLPAVLAEVEQLRADLQAAQETNTKLHAYIIELREQRFKDRDRIVAMQEVVEAVAKARAILAEQSATQDT